MELNLIVPFILHVLVHLTYHWYWLFFKYGVLVSTSVEHVTLQLICNLEAPSDDNYTLKVKGYDEYLVPTSLLSDYEYVHNCIKLEEDIVLILIPDRKKEKPFARTVSFLILS